MRNNPFFSFKTGRSSVDGFTLLEVIVAIALIIIILLPASFLLTSGARLASEAKLRVAGSNLVSRQIACIQSQPIALIVTVNECAGSSLPPGDSSSSPAIATSTTTAGGTVYTLVQETWWQTNTTTNITCLDATVTASWPNNPGPADTISQRALVDCEPSPTITWFEGYLGSSVNTPCFSGYSNPAPSTNSSCQNPGPGQSGAYYDASPGFKSPVVPIIIYFIPPSSGTTSEYVAISSVSFSGSTSDFSLVSVPSSENPTGIQACSDGTVLTVPQSTTSTSNQCIFGVQFTPPSNATVATTPGAAIVLDDNAIGSPQNIAFSGYISPDLLTLS
jgi:Tfp pilus assembly protein PilV